MINLDDITTQAAMQQHLPKQILAALIAQESGGNPNAISSAGAQGLTQLMPDTAQGLGVTNPMDPQQNVMGGAKFLRQMLDKFGGSMPLALAAYNAGPGNVEKYGGIPPFKETQNYVQKIMGNNMPQNNSTNLPDFLMQQIQSQIKPQNKTGSMIGAILGGLSELTASLHPYNGAQLQQQAREANLARQTMTTQNRQKPIEDLLNLYKAQNPFGNLFSQYQTDPKGVSGFFGAEKGKTPPIDMSGTPMPGVKPTIQLPAIDNTKVNPEPLAPTPQTPTKSPQPQAAQSNQMPPGSENWSNDQWKQWMVQNNGDIFK